MELKLRNLFKWLMMVQSFNCTFMELKLRNLFKWLMMVQSFNCTFMELKFCEISHVQMFLKF